MHYLMVRVANEEEKHILTKTTLSSSSTTAASVSSNASSSSRRPLLGRSSLLPPLCGKPPKSSAAKKKQPLTDQAQDIMESTIHDDWSLTVPDDLQNLYPPVPPLASSKSSANSKRNGPAANNNSNSNKIASTDVASVGNASDTSVRVHSQTFSGRDLHETAKYHLNKKSYGKALECFEAILQAQSQRFGPCHPSVGAALHNVGVCRQRMQQHQLAANLFQEAVQIRKQTASQLEVAASLAKLGLAQASLGSSEQAFASLRQALAISRQELGSHKTTAQMLCHLGCFYFETGELFAAQATFQDAYDMYQQVWNHQSSDQQACLVQMVDTLCNIGSIQNRRKRYNDGIETFQQALELITEDAKKVATLDNLAYSYSKVKDYANALACYQKMLRLQSKAPAFTDECFETFRKQVLMHEKLKTSPLELVQETMLLAQSKECSEKVESQIKAMLDKCRKL
jgi:tetratricopeptide (TPR) repeat protein